MVNGKAETYPSLNLGGVHAVEIHESVQTCQEQEKKKKNAAKNQEKEEELMNEYLDLRFHQFIMHCILSGLPEFRETIIIFISVGITNGAFIKKIICLFIVC